MLATALYIIFWVLLCFATQAVGLFLIFKKNTTILRIFVYIIVLSLLSFASYYVGMYQVAGVFFVSAFALSSFFPAISAR